MMQSILLGVPWLLPKGASESKGVYAGHSLDATPMDPHPDRCLLTVKAMAREIKSRSVVYSTGGTRLTPFSRFKLNGSASR